MAETEQEGSMRESKRMAEVCTEDGLETPIVPELSQDRLLIVLDWLMAMLLHKVVFKGLDHLGKALDFLSDVCAG